MSMETFLRQSSGWRSLVTGLIEGTASNHAADFSTTNLPWAYTDTSVFTANWPSGTTIVDLVTTEADFYHNIIKTCDIAGKRVVIRLGTATYHLKAFNMIGSSGNPNYAFGFYHPNLQGFLGNGPDKTIVQMDPNSTTQAQIDAMSTMTAASFAPSQMGFGRLDGTSASPVLVSGVTFRGTDQPDITAVASDVDAVVPQPSPYQGLVLYQNTVGQIAYTRFQGCGHAMTSAPPFEHGSVNTQYGSTTYDHCEMDGRLAPEVNSAQPRRVGPIMMNNETLSQITDCWFHHSNVSRYAANDQNKSTNGTYSLTRTKFEQITNTKNGGLGGYTNASDLGWESTKAAISLTDCIISVDNPYVEGGNLGQSLHLQFTVVASTNPQGGRLTISGNNAWRNTGFPGIDGYLTVRVAPKDGIYWQTDGYNTTMNIQSPDGIRLQPYVWTGTWPPTRAALESVGVYSNTHFIILER